VSLTKYRRRKSYLKTEGRGEWDKSDGYVVVTFRFIPLSPPPVKRRKEL
jgi:hypothetical protein